MLLSGRLNVCEQALWALGKYQKLISFLKHLISPLLLNFIMILANIAVDGPVSREYILPSDICANLLMLIKSNKSITFLHNISWFFINLCGNKFVPLYYRTVKEILPAIEILISIMDNTVSSHV